MALPATLERNEQMVNVLPPPKLVDPRPSLAVVPSTEPIAAENFAHTVVGRDPAWWGYDQSQVQLYRRLKKGDYVIFPQTSNGIAEIKWAGRVKEVFEDRNIVNVKEPSGNIATIGISHYEHGWVLDPDGYYGKYPFNMDPLQLPMIPDYRLMIRRPAVNGSWAGKNPHRKNRIFPYTEASQLIDLLCQALPLAVPIRLFPAQIPNHLQVI